MSLHTISVVREVKHLAYHLISGLQPSYTTAAGAAYCGDSRELLKHMPDDSLDLVMTSPPFALQRQKAYGNRDQAEYLDWMMDFAFLVYAKLKPTGSFVMDVGGAYQKGVPARSLYHLRLPLRFCDEAGFFLAEDFYWYNPAKLPSPIEWVNKRKIRAKDSINSLWWFSKTEWPKADISKVLAPYSDRMLKLMEDPDKFYKPKLRPSGHNIGRGFAKDNGGAIPSNLLQISNTESNGGYVAGCKLVEAQRHPARFPAKLPEYFIRFLTEPGDLVLDIFAGSNTTGSVAEIEGRRWLAFEERLDYLAASIFRFLPKEADPISLKTAYSRVSAGECIDLGDFIPQAELFRAAE